LRSFFRQFKVGEVPPEYCEFVKGNIDLAKKRTIFVNVVAVGFDFHASQIPNIQEMPIIIVIAISIGVK
jgi:hypothetical protein